MKISFILSSFWLSGGVQVIVEFANRLTDRGHQVALVIPGATVAPEMLKMVDNRVSLIESQVVRHASMTPWQNIRLLLSLAQAVPRSDLVISTHTPTTLVGLLAAHILRRGKLVWLFQDYQAMFDGRPLESWLMRHALRWHKMALAVSTYCQQELQRTSTGRIVVVGEGLSDAALFQPIPLALRPTQSQPTIFFLGDRRPRKGLADFLAAATVVYAKMPNSKLWLASKEIGQFVCQVPHEIIERPSRAKLIELYSTCTLFVSASWCEGFGLPPLEAMACGTPVVLTNSGGVQEYAKDGFNCLMTPPRTPHLLANAILQLLNDPALAAQLSHNGALTAQNYQWKDAVARFEAALHEVMH